ncbi:hypothetical protein MYU51_001087 [Penicillium brevicompactum]|uniref:uncharacterized protein n=1 Tax=Penicillium brevicompactum TaxID=5074 RepID=UPI00254125C4|nr:uncharacterized protein N7506_008979 [Penicillium brevicompactum]KAJ5325877.1 hypothetical protein N7506_008979 [Penicillium brevicompactum]
MFRSALRRSTIQTRSWQQPARKISTAPPNAPNASRPSSRWTRRLVYAGIFGTLGYCVGGWVDSKVSSPPFLPGSLEDQYFSLDLQRAFDAIPIVRELRSNPDYEEKNVYDNFADEHKSRRLTSGPLAGSRGLGFQRVFWNGREKTNVSVVFLGRGMEGWPTMIHGGAIGTVIDENLGRIAIRHFPERTGVTANLNLNYRAPVTSDKFYTLHTSLDEEQSTDRKAYAKCEVRDMAGKICVEASGLFVVPKKLKLAKVGEHF